MPVTPTDLLDIIRRTAGLQAGMRTVAEIRDRFGIEVARYPRLFAIHGKPGDDRALVSRTPLHETLYQNHLAAVRQNWARLGITC